MQVQTHGACTYAPAINNDTLIKNLITLQDVRRQCTVDIAYLLLSGSMLHIFSME